MRLESPFGFIDFDVIVDEKYPNGLLLFKGSYIKKEFRRQGKFKEMVNTLFSRMKKGTEVQVSLANKNLVSYFKSMGFEETGEVEFWGKPDNTVNLKGKI
jgi:hypothetical protein